MEGEGAVAAVHKVYPGPHSPEFPRGAHPTPKPESARHGPAPKAHSPAAHSARCVDVGLVLCEVVSVVLPEVVADVVPVVVSPGHLACPAAHVPSPDGAPQRIPSKKYSRHSAAGLKSTATKRGQSKRQW